MSNCPECKRLLQAIEYERMIADQHLYNLWLVFLADAYEAYETHLRTHNRGLWWSSYPQLMPSKAWKN
jgi:hypothetical protein